MDVDNSSSEGGGGGGGGVVGGGGNVDVEQSLLQQFSCMGTTDKEELISQLQKVLGAHLNYSTAAFFLDMNNWNLQAAVCSYFDVESSSKLPSMTLVSDPRASECENIEPNNRFYKSWNVMNSGTEQWPEECYLQCAGGDPLGGQTQVLSCLRPGECCIISIEMLSPPTPGTYQSKWRLCTKSGSYFGDPMWSIVTVVEEGTIALTNQLSHLSDLGGATPVATVPANPFRPAEHLHNGSLDSDMC